MAIEGNLQHVGLADICQLLSMGRKTGCLTISNRPNYGRIFFDKGRVVYASVLNRPDRLGVLLRGNDVVSEEQLSAAIAEQARSGKRLGQILVEQGSLGQEALDRYITIQIEEAVYHLFGWTRGTFRFEPDETPDEDVFLVSINAEGLLLEGARRVDEWGLIEKKIPNFDLIFSVEHMPEEGDTDVELTENQQRILRLIDGARTVDDLAVESGLVEFDTAKALFGLIQAGFVTKTGERTRPGGASAASPVRLGSAFHRSGLYGDAVRQYEALLAQDPANAEARFALAGVHLRVGNYQVCLEQLEIMDDELKTKPGVLRNKALALEMLGELEQAEAVLAQGPAGDAGIALARAIVALKRGAASEARERFVVARKLHGDLVPPPVFYNYWVLAAALDGDLTEAIRIGNEGAAHHPENSALLVNVGAVTEHIGEEDAAEALFLKAVALEDPPPQAHKNLGDFAFRRGDYPGARAHYERAVKLDPRLGDDVYCKLAQIADEEEDHDWARLLWKRALELNPRNTSARAAMERLEAHQGS